jgi:hypothetical protein
MLVAWNRLIGGSYRDPLIGRDLLVGCAAGVSLAILSFLGDFIASSLGASQPVPSTGSPIGTFDTLYLLSGTRATIVGLAYVLFSCTIYALLIGFFLFLLRTLLRSTWAAAVVSILGISTMFITGRSSINYMLPVILMPLVLSAVIHIFVILRFGLLALIADQFFFNLLCLFPITTQLSAWYFAIGGSALAIVLALSLYAFYTSLGDRPMFGRASLED